MIHLDFWEEIEELLEIVQKLHRKWCNKCGKPKPELGGQRTWIISGVVRTAGRIWEQCMLEVPGTRQTCDHNKKEPFSQIEATETLKRYLEGTLKATEEDIELELNEMQETLRKRWHRFYKTHNEVSDDGKREHMPRVRGEGDGKDHIDIERIKVWDDDNAGNRKF